MFYLDRDGTLAQHHHRDLLTRSAAARRAERQRRVPVLRRLAEPAGRTLVRLGAALIRYSRLGGVIVLVQHRPDSEPALRN